MGPRWDSKFELKPGKWVFVPNEETLRLGKVIKESLAARWKPPSYFFHLRSGGHVAALRSHLGQTRFLHLDIQSFFESINRTRVTRCLKGLYSYDEARDIANVSTVQFPSQVVRKFALPYGFVQSPLLASLCLHRSALGGCLKRLSRTEGVVVSVYVDDIVISTCDSVLGQKILTEVKAAASRAAFTLNDAKQEGPAEMISAFNISLSENALTLDTARWQSFLEVLKASTSDYQQEGILGYVASVNPDQAIALAKAM